MENREQQTLPTRSRTKWTPPMERYFIELMLDQIQKGNKLEQAFNKVAWKEMTELFNHRFNLKLSRDSLKNRHQTLWRHWEMLKDIIEQSGFSWDPEKQMVTAEDTVWDAYIMTHLKANNYRRQTQPDYDALSTIFQDTNADGRYSRTGIDVGEEIRECTPSPDVGEPAFDSFGEMENEEQQIQLDGSRTEWTLPVEQYFIELMADQTQKSNKLGQEFTKVAWKKMAESLNQRFNLQLGKDILKNRHKTLRRQWGTLKGIIEQNGFSWDPDKKMVTAEDPVWDAYIRAHPEATTYRRQTQPDYDALCIIFEDNNADCKQSRGIHVDEADQEITPSPDGMENHEQAQPEPSRTKWTLPLERYFIELMVDQVQKGNKLDQTFTKVSWKEMPKLLNQRFNIQLDREILKNRLRTFRRQWLTMKEMIEENGFSWDMDKQMITADDPVWDAYILTYPKARYYRRKTLPDYDALCTLFRDIDANGRCNHTSIDVDEGHQEFTPSPDGRALVSFRGVEDQEQQAHPERTRTTWTLPMERYFIELMVDQTQKSRRLGRGFNKLAWKEMTKLLNQRLNLQLDTDHLKNRHKGLRKQWSMLKGIIEQSGFAWDPNKQMITADERVWDAFIMKHPKADSYRRQTQPDYAALCTIFQDTNAVGKNNSTRINTDEGHQECTLLDATEPVDTTEPVFVSQYMSVEQAALLDNAGDSSQSSDEVQQATTQKKRRCKMLSTSQKRRRGQTSNDVLISAVQEMADALKLIAKGHEDNSMLQEKCIRALKDIPDLDRTIYLKSFELFEDVKKARTFLAMQPSDRKDWLSLKFGQ